MRNTFWNCGDCGRMYMYEYYPIEEGCKLCKNEKYKELVMTKDEIIEMGMQAGISKPVLLLGNNLKLLTAFAKLVAEHEREECIKIVMQGTGEPVQTRTLEIINQERERIVDGIRKHQYD